MRGQHISLNTQDETRQVFASWMLLTLFVFFLSYIFSPGAAFAAEGEAIFKEAAGAIVIKILPGSFGATVAVVTGILALVSAAVGSYKGAWALLFVCIACRLAQNFVELLFPAVG